MFLFLKKKSGEDDAAPSIAPAEPRDLHEFIPCHGHYDARTLLTRNGELMQIIRIARNNADLTYENAAGGDQALRECLRRAIRETITTDRYALWVHTVRKRKPVHYGSRFDNAFAAHVHEAWQKKHRWKYQYYNEVYVTVLHEGQGGTLLDKAMFKHVFLPRRNRAWRNAYLDRAAVELDAVVAGLAERIRRHYRAERLSIAERAGNEKVSSIFYSEPLEFLHALVNLKTEPVPVRELDAGKILNSHALTFGFNALESKSPDGARRYAAIISLKQYREIPARAADRLLQAPIEFVVSQAFVFAPASKVLRQYRAQKELFEISGDDYSPAASGLEEMLKGDRGLSTDYGEAQTTVMVLADEYRHVDEEVQKVQDAFADIGLITVREDIKIEECFWAQIPGNFDFIRRRDSMSAERAAGFCRLNLFSGGRDYGNHWGEAAALLPTTVGSPYFFNFHQKDNGHTAVFDFNSFRDNAGRMLLNFLLTCTFKYQGRMFVFDRNRSSYLWFDKIGGEYHRLPIGAKKPAPGLLALNPFTLEDGARNRAFLLAWLTALLEPYFAVQEEHRKILAAAIGDLYGQPPENRHLKTLVDIAAASDYRLAAAFAPFHSGGELAGLFDGVRETFDPSRPFNAFDMDPALKAGATAVPLFAYLLHRIVSSLDGRPAIIVLHEAWDLLENAFLAPRLESLLEMLTQNNVMMICATQYPDAQAGKQSFSTFLQHAASQIILPDDIVLDYPAHLPGLSAREAGLLSRMDRQRGHFLLKTADESIALSADFDGMDDIRAVLGGDVKTLIAAGGRFASLPQMYGHEDSA